MHSVYRACIDLSRRVTALENCACHQFPEFAMQKFFSADTLHAIAQLVIVLDQHPIGAVVFCCIVAAGTIATWRRR
jgi:hypothetical protein